MIKKIRVEDLEVGMFVEDFNVPWMDHPFLVNRKTIRSLKEIQLLVDRQIREVYIDTSRGRDSAKAVSAEEDRAELREEMTREVLKPARAADPPPAADPSPFEEEMDTARGICGRAKVAVKEMLEDVRMGRSIDGERTARLVDEMVESIFRNKHALVSLSRLKSFDDYTFHHSVNVAVLSLALGRHLGILKGELRRLGIGAILHDVGKMMIPEEILNKPGRLTSSEFAVIQTHTLHGARILMESRDVPDDCAAVAMNHHERFDGRGYPRAVQGLAIGKFGLIAAIADVYDAITSDRVYHKGIPGHQALQKIYEWARTDFYPIYAEKFIQCIGVYPVGSLVGLDTGETGVVCRPNYDQLLRPRVRLVRRATGEPMSPAVEVDLAEPQGAGYKAFARSIRSVLDPAAFGVDVEAVLQGGLTGD
jgi:putative nucleotidyltransferase with HDIG domain